jgi:hypothetical protein
VEYIDSASTSGTVKYTYTIAPNTEDTTSPSVTIDQAGSQSDPTNGSTIDFTAEFSESVSDFDESDVTLGGTAGATTAVVTGSGKTYNVAVSGMATSGTVTASIAAGVAHDGAGNASTASTSTDNSVTYALGGTTTGAVILDGSVSSATGAANADSVSFSHTTGSGENRLLLVGVSWNCGTTTATQSISSVKFTYGTNELDLTQKIVQEASTSSNYKRYAAIWYSPEEPPQNTAGTITVNFNTSVPNGIVAGAANFAGVDQTTPFTVTNGASSSSSTAPTVTLSSLNGNELVFDTAFIGASTPPDPTVGDNQTKLWTATVSNTRGVASTEQAAGSSVTIELDDRQYECGLCPGSSGDQSAEVGITHTLTMAASRQRVERPLRRLERIRIAKGRWWMSALLRRMDTNSRVGVGSAAVAAPAR